MEEQERRPRRRRRRRRPVLRLLVALLCVAALVAGESAALDAVRGRFFPADQSTAQAERLGNDGADPADAAPPADEDDGGEDGAGQDGGQAAQTADWNLILVNRWHLIPEGYADNIELTELDGGEQVDARIADALMRMLDDARADGIYGVVVSGFRTQEKQQSLLDEKIAAFIDEGYSRADAEAAAETWVALPGASEHQLGLAADINADGVHSTGQEVYDWLRENAAAYGFILRYPEDKTELTGASYEPWHYRYVGEEAARAIMEQGLCLEEYCAALS